MENYAWGSMAHLLNVHKFDCVKSKDLDEKSTIAKLEVYVSKRQPFLFSHLRLTLPTPVSLTHPDRVDHRRAFFVYVGNLDDPRQGVFLRETVFAESEPHVLFLCI